MGYQVFSRPPVLFIQLIKHHINPLSYADAPDVLGRLCRLKDASFSRVSGGFGSCGVGLPCARRLGADVGFRDSGDAMLFCNVSLVFYGLLELNSGLWWSRTSLGKKFGYLYGGVDSGLRLSLRPLELRILAPWHSTSAKFFPEHQQIDILSCILL